MLGEFLREARRAKNVQSLSTLGTRALHSRQDQTHLEPPMRMETLDWCGPDVQPTHGYDGSRLPDLPLSSLPPSPRTSTSPTQIEIFVDASCWGIGFVMEDYWLTWKLKPGWNSSGRDISWSEMLAVELGVRALISSDLSPASVTIRSDNSGVVQALRTGRSKHAQQLEILRNIFYLTDQHGIEMKPVWVPSEDNYADRYSRGEVGPKPLMFPGVPIIPPYLEAFVELVMPKETRAWW
jgi:hypothetical protein